MLPRLELPRARHVLADAYEALVANNVDYVPLDEISGRISATLALIYPPGIGVIVPGERGINVPSQCSTTFLLSRIVQPLPGLQLRSPGVFQERVNGRIKFHTYVVRE